MFTNTNRKNGMRLLAAIAALSLLAACGGEEGGGGDKQSGGSTGTSGGGAALVCFAYLLVSGNDDCLGYGSGGSSSLGGFSSGGRYVVNHDLEPNNDWMNSNQLIIERTTSPDGFIVDGDVNDSSDVADTFSFVRGTGRNFRFKW